MIDLGPHALFIVWAYVGVALAMVGLIGWTLYDARAATKNLAALEARRSKI